MSYMRDADGNRVDDIAVKERLKTADLQNGSPLVRSMVGASVMPTPPTLTASSSAPGAYTRTLRLYTANTNYWSGFRQSGAPVMSGGSSTTALLRGATKGTPAANTWGGCGRVEFDLYGDGFVFSMQASTSAFFKVWANEQPHSASMQQCGTVSGVSGTGTHHFTVDFGTVAYRRIVFEYASQPATPATHQGFRFKPTATVLPPSIPSPRFMVIGDSYSYGVGATDVSDAFAIQLGRQLGFADIWNFTAVPSTGTLAADGVNDYGQYSTRFTPDVVPYMRAGDVLLYLGSVNDGAETAGAVQTQATADLAALKTALPDTKIVVGSPLYMTTPTASHTRVRDEIAAAATANGLPFIDLVNTNLNLWNGTGTIDSPAGDGNADTNAKDVGGIHPTSQGARSLARRASQLIGAILGQTANGTPITNNAVTSVAGQTGTVTLTKNDVGLGNVDNTADTAKPVSTLQQAAIDAKIVDSIADADTTHAPSRNAVYDALTLKADATSAIPLPTFSFASGSYIIPHPTSGTSSGQSNNQLRLFPWFCPQTLSIARIGGEITAAGEAGSKMRLGIYADNGNGFPGALVLDAGQINGDSATVQEITLGSPTVLTRGWYWLGGCVQSAPSSLPTVRVPTIIQAPGWLVSLGTSAPAAGAGPFGAAQSSVTGALPSTFAGTPANVSSAPRIHFKLS